MVKTESLVRALGKQRHQDHQVRQREQPLIRLFAGCFRRAGNEAQVAALRKIAKVIDADSREARNLCIGEDLLARLNRDHGLVPSDYRHTARYLFDASCRVRDASVQEQ